MSSNLTEIFRGGAFLRPGCKVTTPGRASSVGTAPIQDLCSKGRASSSSPP